MATTFSMNTTLKVYKRKIELYPSKCCPIIHSEREWGAAQNFEAMTHTQSGCDETFLASQKQRERVPTTFLFCLIKARRPKIEFPERWRKKKDGEQLLLMYSKSNTCKAARKKRNKGEKKRKLEPIFIEGIISGYHRKDDD